MKTDELTIQTKILEIKAKWFNLIKSESERTTESHKGCDDIFFQLKCMFEDCDKEIQAYKDKVKSAKNRVNCATG